jgi:predicted phage terminase large subunit-like protein
MGALMYADVPGTATILFRRTYADLALPGAIMDRAKEWLSPTAARWSEQTKTWTFPSGATLSFGYLDHEDQKLRYQSAEFQYVGFDELTQFTETQYTYLFSRLRRKAESPVAIRMRAATNPGGPGHQWVKTRFIDNDDTSRSFIPAKLTDNQYIDQDAYLESLNKLDAVTRAQLKDGNWDVTAQGNVFKREWFEVVETLPGKLEATVRYWDKAGTPNGGDWSAGVLMGKFAGIFFIPDVVRGQLSARQRNLLMRTSAHLDEDRFKGTSIWIEQEPGSGGKESAERSIQELAGFDVHTETVTGSKLTRTRPFSAQCEAGNVKLLAGKWNWDYVNELCGFTGEEKPGQNDDQVDASSGAFNHLTGMVYKTGSGRYA